MFAIYQALVSLVKLAELAVVAYCALTWIAPRSDLRYALEKLLAPICAPFYEVSRAIMRRFNLPIDLTCLFTLIALQATRRFLWAIYLLLRRIF